MKNELIVQAIKQGTVIDHLHSKKLFKVLSIIDAENMQTRVFIGNNLESKKYGSKGIIKIADKFPSLEDINKIALIDPNAVINIIENYKVVEKKKVMIPESVNKIVRCINPKCITNNDNVVTKFTVLKNEDKIDLKCFYCEKITEQDNIEIIA